VIARLALLLLSAVLSLVGAELWFRFTNPLWAINYPPVCYRPDIYRQVPWAYTLWPFKIVKQRYPLEEPRTITLESNAEGFRAHRDFRVSDPRPRILVLGDSMVFGVGIEESERFTDLLEDMEPDWRVDNMGMTAYGPDLMVRALEKIGVHVKPDVVVLALFTHDLYRVVPEGQGVGFAVPRFALRDGHLVTVPYPDPPPFLWRLRLVQGARYLYWRYTSATFPLNEAILDRFLSVSSEHNIQPAIIFLPGVQDWADDRRRRGWLASYAGVRGVPFLDLTDGLTGPGSERFHIPNDSHWNLEGNRVAAKLLRPFLARMIQARS